jgi:hypothetical protein
MASTWIKPLHVNKGKTIAQTLADRTDYAENPEKTEGGELVLGYECDPRTADEEFLLAKHQYDYLTGRSQGENNILAYHIRQSFKPGETNPQEAGEIGYQLALRFTKGKHAFLVAVHTDKAHLHCHIIFNSTNLECTGKFKNFWKSSFAVRRISDLICAEHGLSIIENPKPSRGRNYHKWLGDEKGASWQEKLKMAIDEILPTCDSFEAFINKMQAKGYTVRQGGKHISMCAPEQKRPTRLNTLGGDYTEAAIRDRIAEQVRDATGSNGGFVKLSEQNGGYDKTTEQFSSDQHSDKIIENSSGNLSDNSHIHVNLLIDIQAKIRAGKGPGYEHWARIFNLKQAAKTLVFLQEKGIDNYQDLLRQSDTAVTIFHTLTEKIKTAEKRMKEIAELEKQIGIYGKTRETYAQYKASGWSRRFYEEHASDLIRHKAAKNFFNELGLKTFPKISELKQEYAKTLAEKKKLYASYHKEKELMQQLLTAKKNAQSLLGIEPEQTKIKPSRAKGQERSSQNEKDNR